MGRNTFWTEAEIDLLRKIFPIEGAACSARFPGRTKCSVISQAYEMGLKNTPNWSEAEDDILRKYYPSEGCACHAKIPGRSAKGVGMRAIRLGLKYTGGSKSKNAWTDKEDAILREYYPEEGRAILSRLPGRTLPAVWRRVGILGVKCRHHGRRPK